MPAHHNVNFLEGFLFAVFMLIANSRLFGKFFLVITKDDCPIATKAGEVTKNPSPPTTIFAVALVRNIPKN